MHRKAGIIQVLHAKSQSRIQGDDGEKHGDASLPVILGQLAQVIGETLPEILLLTSTVPREGQSEMTPEAVVVHPANCEDGQGKDHQLLGEDEAVEEDEVLAAHFELLVAAVDIVIPAEMNGQPCKADSGISEEQLLSFNEKKPHPQII